MTRTLAEVTASLGLSLSEEQLGQLVQFRDLLAASANEFNLTSLRDPLDIERRHLVESLAFGVFLDRHGLLHATGTEARSMLDIGTGAGLPGIPIKIGWPDLRLTLLESVRKKCRFLEQVCAALGLADVDVFEGRAEDFGHEPSQRESYDLAIARAVAPLSVLLEYSLPALRIGGWLAAPKGSAASSELDAAGNALELLGGRIRAAAPFQTPGGFRQTVILVEKVARTPERYPRRPGIPSKRPL